MSIITGSAQDDTLDGTGDADTLQGFEGADSLNGQAGTDVLFGGAGNDRLNGGDLTGSAGASDDTLVGGAGDDVLFGRRGNDDYVFGEGFGQDEILNSSAAADERDRVVFDATVDRADIRLTTVFDKLQTSDLIIISDDDGSSIFLDDFIVGGTLENGLREVVFADGTILTLDQGLLLTGGDAADTMAGADQADTLDGADGDDFLNGMAGTDVLFGGAGNDRLNGGDLTGSAGASDDTLVGGAGDDVLFGRRGNDDYVFGEGFGQDEILNSSAAADERDRVVFDATVDRADIRLTTVFDKLQTSDLIIISDDDGSSIFLDDFIVGGTLENGLREVVFADGTILTLDQGLLLTGGDAADTMAGADQADTLDGADGDDFLNGMGGADLLIGRDGDDTLTGGNRQGFTDNSDDTLIGGAGDDFMTGRGGDDEYVFSAGFGQDEIQDNNALSGDRDRVFFDATVNRADIRVTTVFDQTQTSDLIIISDDDGSTIFLDDFILGGTLENGLREVVFEDGTILTLDQGLLLTGGSGDDDMASADQADTLDGGDGDDRLNGMGGADLLIGGAGDDTLSGGNRLGFIDSSNDTLIGGAGNDRLIGRGGDDDFLFGARFGQDEIQSNSSADTDRDRIVFDATIDRADINIRTANTSGNVSGDLVLESLDDGSSITVAGLVDNGRLTNGVRVIAFADGTVIDLDLGFPLDGTAGNDTLIGLGGADILRGLAGDDRLNGVLGADQIFGGAGQDTLDGGARVGQVDSSDDTLAGGTDDDRLTGRGGNDTFVFNDGDGSDAITDFTSGDIVDLRGVTAISQFTDITALAAQNGDDTVLDLGSGDSITLEGVTASALIAADFLIEPDNANLIRGTDGDDSLSGDGFGNIIEGLGGNDTIDGASGDDQLFGGTGGDTLFGASGADTLEGGQGNDKLNGANGNDTYIFSAGFGADEILTLGASPLEQDRLLFDTGIDRADVRLFSIADPFDLSADLFIQDDADGSNILVSNFYNPNRGGSFGQLRSGFEIVEFADGTTIDLRQGFELVGDDGADHMRGPNLNDRLSGLGGADTLEGRNGNDGLFGGDGADELLGGSGDDELFGGTGGDTLFGASGADTLEGGQGNDKLNGANGNDTYIFSAGFGADEILTLGASALEQDRLFFDTSIDRTDIRLFSLADPFDLSADLVIQHDTDGSHILITDFYNPNRGGNFGQLRAGFEVLEFADGTVVALRQGLELVGNGGADFMRGPNLDDRLSGLGGDDTLEGHIGDDSLFGGDGGDALLGSSGNDLLSGGDGDDTLSGEADADTLDGGAGADSLSGDAGDDLFIFLANGGDDRVLGFQAGNQTEDRLDVSALGFTRFADVLAVATDGAEGVALALGSGTSVLLEDVQAGDLSADDFILAPDTTVPLQRIDPAVDAFIVGAGDRIAVTGVYATANPVDETLAGIGVRVHFDSSALQFDGLENLFPQALQPFGQVAEADSGDFDNDAATDTFVALSWADFGDAFPGDGATPLDLFDILFTGLGDLADTRINFSASSVANGREFTSTSVDVAADRWPLPDTVEVAENSGIGAVVADLAPAVVDPADPGTFTLLDDAGGRFVLDGFVLEVATGDALDFEGVSSHDVAVRITNNAGGSIDRQITVNLTDVNEAPTAISIDTGDIDEDAESGDQVGVLASLDPEGDVIDFTLVDTAGGRFALDGDRLVVAGGGLDFETAQSHAITVRATDTGGLSLDQVLNITVNDIAEATLDLDGDGQVNALTDGLIALGDLFNAPLSQLTALAASGSPGADGSVLSGTLDAARAEIFDVDDNGTVDALTDGLMILSHLFDAPPDQVAGFAAPDAARTDPAEIAAFLDSFIPVDATV